MGEEDHSDLQTHLIELLLTPENKAYIRANTELRVQVKLDNFRVPDVCVRPRNAPKERFVTQSPLLCIEILSPRDTDSQHEGASAPTTSIIGVPEVWLIDPEVRSVTIYAGSTIVEHTSERSQCARNSGKSRTSATSLKRARRLRKIVHGEGRNCITGNHCISTPTCHPSSPIRRKDNRTIPGAHWSSFRRAPSCSAPAVEMKSSSISPSAPAVWTTPSQAASPPKTRLSTCATSS